MGGQKWYEKIPVFRNASKLDYLRLFFAYFILLGLLGFALFRLFTGGHSSYVPLVVSLFVLTLIFTLLPVSLPLRIFASVAICFSTLFTSDVIPLLPAAFFFPFLLFDYKTENKPFLGVWIALGLFFTGYDLQHLFKQFSEYLPYAWTHLFLFISATLVYGFISYSFHFQWRVEEEKQRQLQETIKALKGQAEQLGSELAQKRAELSTLEQKESQLKMVMENYQQQEILLWSMVDQLRREKQELDQQRQMEAFRQEVLQSVDWTPGQTLQEWVQEVLLRLQRILHFQYATFLVKYMDEEEWRPVGSFGVPLSSSFHSDGLLHSTAALKKVQVFEHPASIQVASPTFTLTVPVLLALPFVFANETIGVLFLGFQEQPTNFLTTLDDFRQRMADILQAILQQEYIQHLLQVSQEKTEELQAQEEELRQNLEELHATQEQLRQTQQEILRQRNQLRAVFHTLDSVVIATDERSRITLFNPQAQRLFSALAEGEELTRILPEESQIALLTKRCMETGASQSDEISFQGKYWEVKTAPILNQQQQVKGVCLVMNDVTELRQQERRIRYLVNNLPGAAYTVLVTLAQELQVQFVSNPIVELTGILARDFKQSNLPLSQIFHPDDREKVMETIQGAIEKNIPFEMEHRIRSRSGETKWVFHKGKPYYENEQVFIDGFLLDITERVEKGKQVEELMQSLEDKVKERTQQLEASYAELAAFKEQLLHSEKLALLGQLFSGIAHEIKTPLGAVISSTQNIQDIFPSLLSSFPKVIRGMSEEQTQQFLSFLSELLANQKFLSSREGRQLRKQLVAELEEAGCLEADLVARRLLSAGYANATLGSYLSLFQGPIGVDLSEACFHVGQIYMNLHNISVAGEKTRKILEALKRYSHGGVADNPEPTNVKETIETILVLYSHQFKYNIQLETYFDESVPEILGYPDELGQVWTNLIMNALDAMKNEGRLEIRLEQDEHYVIVKVTDSGPGIPPEIKDKIFKPFFTTKARGKGTGLGLHLCKQIIEKHGGKIEVDSEPGRTTFTVFLPKKGANP